MNISISNSTVRALVGASALGLAAAAGFVGGRTADATPTQDRPAITVARASVPAREFAYYVVDSQQAALDIERAEYMTAQERVLAGIIAPERVVHITDDSDAGRMTA